MTNPAAVSAPARTPFLGLRYFTEEHADLFFGRDEEVDELLGKLHNSRFVTVIGSSGSGKSSLVGAGLIPALRAGYLGEAGSRWHVLRATPGSDPTGNLAAALGGDQAFSRAGLEAALRRGPLGLVEAVKQRRFEPDANVLVIADQFEEIFRYLRAAANDPKLAARAEVEAADYVKLLLEAAAQRDVSIYVVLTMRSDFLGDCARFRNLPERINNGLYLIPRMRRDQLEQAITGPVRVAGEQIEPRLVERMLNDIGEDQDQLPVLQHALLRTWNQRPQGTRLDLEQYDAVGRLAAALGGQAEEIYKRFTGRQKHLCEAIFRRLTEVDESREIRRAATIDELAAVSEAPAEEVQPIVDEFRADGVSFLTQTGSLIDITHESLIRQWNRLREWARQETADRKEYLQLANAAATDLPRGIWLRGGQLDRAEEWLNQGLTENWAGRYGGEYRQTVEFIRLSLRQRQRERRRTWWLLAGVSAVAMVVAALALLFYRARLETAGANVQLRDTNGRLKEASAELKQKADETARINQKLTDTNGELENSLKSEEQARTEARRQRMLGVWQSAARQADRDLLDHADDDRAALLARQAVLFHRITPEQPRYLIENVLQAAAYESLFAHVLAHREYVNSVAFAHDGNRLASGGGGTVRVWDLRQPLAPTQVFSGSEGDVRSVAFSPDGNRLASVGGGATVRVWDLRQPQAPPQLLSGHQGSTVYSVAFAADGNHLASGSDDATVRVWDLRQPLAPPQTLSGYQGFIYSVAFAPDGNRVASGSDDGIVAVWDLRHPEARPRILSGHRSDVDSVAFAPDGNTLASSGVDETVRVWDLRRPESPPQVLIGHRGWVNSVTFAPDGKRLASAGDDHTARVWDLGQPQTPPQVLTGHRGFVRSVAFAPDGNRLASAGWDRTVRVWDVAKAQALPQVLTGHRSAVLSVAFDPDGNRLTSASFDRTVRVWDLRQSRSSAHVLSGDQGLVHSVAFAPGGSHVASAGLDLTVRVWDLRHPEAPPQVLTGHQNYVRSVAFAPDGNHLASASIDRTVRVWDLQHPEAPPQVLNGHHDFVLSVAFAPDGVRLASGGADRTVRVWDLRHPEASPQVLSGHQDSVESIAFAPDGNRLASSSREGTVRVWDLRQPQAPPQILSGHQKDVTSLAFAPDGNRLASASADWTVRLWDLRQPQAPPQVLSLPQSIVTSVAFAPDGNRLATAGNDGTLRVWPLWTAAADYLCTRVWRNLSMEEWRFYIGDGIPYERTCPNLPPGFGTPAARK